MAGSKAERPQEENVPTGDPAPQPTGLRVLAKINFGQGDVSIKTPSGNVHIIETIDLATGEKPLSEGDTQAQTSTDE